MKMPEYKRLILQLIAEGCDTPIALQTEVQRLALFAGRAITPRAVNKARTHGPPLQQALNQLCHGRKIRYDKAHHRWQVIDRPTYHPAATTRQLLESNAKTIPKIDRRILLL
jgi:hypothetical protein